MDPDNQHAIYLISYLIAQTEEGRIVGYSTLSARLYSLLNRLKQDEKITRSFEEEISSLIQKEDDNTLSWKQLKEFLSEAENDQIGGMFISIESEEVEANKWSYEFTSKPPEGVLDREINNLLPSDEETRFKEKVSAAATIDEDDLFKEVYST